MAAATQRRFPELQPRRCRRGRGGPRTLSEVGVISFPDRISCPPANPGSHFSNESSAGPARVAVFLGQRMGSWQHRKVQVAWTGNNVAVGR
jgi:hypothetical protein